MPKNKSSRGVWIGLVLAAAAVLLAFLFFSDPLKEGLEAATGWAEEVMSEHPVAGAAAFFLFSAFSAMLAFASSTVLVPPATEAWGRPITFVLLWGGWMAGAAVAYAIGYLAHPLVVRMGYGAKLAEYKEFASKRMRFWAVLLLCFAVPSEIPGYLFGGVHYPFWKYFAAMGVAEAVYAIGVVVAGDSLLEADPVQLLVALGVLAAVVGGAGWLLRRQRK